MVKWSVGDSVDYEVCTLRQKCLGCGALKMRRRVCTMAWRQHAVDAPQVNGTWYPGYIARSDSKKLYFKYEASKFKSYEEPIDKASRDDLARLRAGSGSGPPASAKKKKPAARKPAAKSPAKKKTVRARGIHSLPLVAREDPLSHRSLNPRPENQRPSKWPSQRLRSLPRSRASPESMTSRRWRPPPRRRRGATRHPGAGPRRKNQRSRRVPRRRSRPPARKRSSSLRTVYLLATTT